MKISARRLARVLYHRKTHMLDTRHRIFFVHGMGSEEPLESYAMLEKGLRDAWKGEGAIEDRHRFVPVQRWQRTHAVRLEVCRSVRPSRRTCAGSQPRATSTNEVVAKGAAQGLKFSANLVYMVRSKMGKLAGRAPIAKPAVAKAKPAPKPKGVAPEPKGATGSDVAFRKLVVALGVERSSALLADVERRLAAIIGG